MTTTLLVLTLNEIDGMKEVMPKIKKEWVDEIILVDGGSTDGTIEEAKRMGIRVLHQTNRGHGDALLLGINKTESEKYIFFSPDGNHYPEEILLLKNKLNEGYDQVVISRFGKGSINLDADIVERFGNKMFAFLTNVFFGGKFSDTLNESRAITRKAFLELNFDALKMDSTQQMSIRGLKKKQKIFEIVGNEGERVGGKQKMKPLQVGANLSTQIIREFIFWKF